MARAEDLPHTQQCRMVGGGTGDGVCICGAGDRAAQMARLGQTAQAIAAQHNPPGVKSLEARQAEHLAAARQRDQDAKVGRLLRELFEGGQGHVSVCQGPEVWSAVTWRGGQLRMDATSYTGKGLLEALRAAHAKHGDTE